MKGILAFLLILVLLTFAFVIGSQNETLITVNYLIAQANLRVSTLIAITLSIGVGIGVHLMLVSWLRLRVQLLTAQSKLQSLENNR
ncbi:MAG: LapA family protein [Pseudomonadota bacterium]|nr:LapA family protein [Pseudomonadota bacterium]